MIASTSARVSDNSGLAPHLGQSGEASEANAAGRSR